MQVIGQLLVKLLVTSPKATGGKEEMDNLEVKAQLLKQRFKIDKLIPRLRVLGDEESLEQIELLNLLSEDIGELGQKIAKRTPRVDITGMW